MPELHEIVDSLNRGVAEMRAKIDEHDKAIKKGGDDVVRRDEIARIDAEISEHQKVMDVLAREQAQIRIGGTGAVGNRETPERAEHHVAFNGYIRRGAEADLHGLAVRAALQTQSDADGGFVVPESMDTAIARVQATRSVVRAYARVQPITTGTFKKIHNKGGATGGWVGERGTRSETNTPQLAELSFPVHEIYAQPAATQTMLDDSAIDVEAWLSTEVGITFDEYEGAAFISGSGQEKPRGFTTYTMVANSSYAWGSVGYVATGASGAFGSTPGDNILDLVYALKPAYRQNGVFLMADSTAALVRKMKDGDGNYLWQPSFQAGQPQLLVGKPMDTDDNIDAVAADKYALAFADWQQAYIVVDRQGVRTIRDNLTSKPYVLFYTTKRVGGGIQNFEAIKLLKFAAS